MANGYASYEITELEDDIIQAIRGAEQGQKIAGLQTHQRGKEIASEASEDVRKITEQVNKDLAAEKKDYGWKKFFDNPIVSILSSLNPVTKAIHLAGSAVTDLGHGFSARKHEKHKLDRILSYLEDPAITAKYKGTRVEQSMLDSLTGIKDPVTDIREQVSGIKDLDIVGGVAMDTISDYAMQQATGKLTDKIGSRIDVKKAANLLGDDVDLENLTEDSITEAMGDNPEFASIIEGLPEGVSQEGFLKDVIKRIEDPRVFKGFFEDMIGQFDPIINQYGEELPFGQERSAMSWLQALLSKDSSLYKRN